MWPRYSKNPEHVALTESGSERENNFRGTLPPLEFALPFIGDVIKVINNHHHVHHHEVQLAPNINYNCQTSSLGCLAS